MNYCATDTQLTAIADAIRTKTHGSAQLEFPDGFTGGISGISAKISYNEASQIYGLPGWTVSANSETKVIENLDGCRAIKGWTFSSNFTGKKYCYFRAEPKPTLNGIKTDIFMVNPTDDEVTTVGNVTIKTYSVTAVI